jgi:hypothetical protein
VGEILYEQSKYKCLPINFFYESSRCSSKIERAA